MSTVVIQSTGAQGPIGVGVPSGGTTGQVLAKNSGADYDTEWVTGGGGGGVSDHGDLSGLADDDHTQYHNDTRGDLRYEAKNANIQSHISSTFNPHSVTKSQVGLGSVVNADTTTTSNITDSSNKRFVTDANLTVIGNTSGTNTGDQDLSGYQLISSLASSVRGVVLTGLSLATSQVIAATDTILEAFGYLQAQVTLRELLSNKDNGSLSTSTTTYPTSGAVKTYADSKQPLDTQLTSIAALSYTGNALKVLRVNSGETDFELVTPTSGGTWGSITGTLSSQTDLQSALDAKQNSLGFTPEDVANKDNGSLSSSATTYPTSGAVKTYADLKVPFTGAASTVDLNALSLTSAQDNSTLELTSTWNTTGTPTALKISLTDTASNTNSKVIEAIVGGLSVFSVDKNGNFVFRKINSGAAVITMTSTSGSLTFGSEGAGGYFQPSGGGRGFALYNSNGSSIFNLLGAGVSSNAGATLTCQTLTSSTSGSAFAITQTWNTTGTPTSLDLNVTDTASNAASLLFNLRVAGTSKFKVGKGGDATLTSFVDATSYKVSGVSGATGTFTTVDLKTVTVTNGIITSIV